MKRTRRMAGVLAIALVASFLVIGCGDSVTGPLIADDGDGGGGGVTPGKGAGGGAALVVDQDSQVEK